MVQSPPLEPFRWAAVAIGLIVATANISTTSYRRLSACVIEVVYAAIRTVRPVDVTGERAAVEIVLEIAFQSAVVLGTGAWWSPFAFSLVPAVLLAGLARGTRFALLATTPALAIISIRHVFVSVTISRGLRESALWAVLLLLVAVGSGLAHQVTRETVQQRSLALDRVGRLAEANALLSSLHRVAQTLPASLDLDEVLDSTLGRVRDLLPLDIAAVLLAEPSDGTWSVARQTGGRPLRGLTAEHLPLPAQSALTHMGTWSETELGAPVGIGFDPSSASGLYAALRARGTVVGLLVIEGERPGQFGAREVELVNGLVEAFGISIDNARFFARLRSIGADEERTRIARDLHDEIGQSLAHLGFELDRAVRHAQRGDDVQASLVEVRDHVRGVVRQVRETLYDLRTEVTDGASMATTLGAFLQRVDSRTDMTVLYERLGQDRLPLRQERELWRLAQEAILNVERHAAAATLWVSWRCASEVSGAELVVRDDGRGFDPGTVRVDAYGITGMRERATAIGARFEIDTTPGRGTTITVTVPPPPGPTEEHPWPSR